MRSGLHAPAFASPSLLAYFRRRLARSARPNRVFQAVREVVKATGVLKGKHRRALDSTLPDPNWNFLHIPQDVLPALREACVSDKQIDTMLVDNPRRYFTAGA